MIRGAFVNFPRPPIFHHFKTEPKNKNLIHFVTLTTPGQVDPGQKARKVDPGQNPPFQNKAQKQKNNTLCDVNNSIFWLICV